MNRVPRLPRLKLAAAAGIAMVATACGGVQPPPPPTPPADLIVLTTDPETNALGRAVVEAQGRRVELTEDRAATRVTSGLAPTSPTILTVDDVQRRFADVQSARPPQPLEFLLYFETGSDTLTADSQAALTRTVDVIRSRAVPDVSVIGHTDTTGDSRLNATLGLQRATLIRNQLIAAGLPAEQIEATSHGEADLLVPTADNVAEARNRRVEITVR